jgi:hypothetical protein
MGGAIRTGSDDPKPEVLERYRIYVRYVTKGFVALKDWRGIKWWVGPEALKLLDDGVRLITSARHAPDTFEDLHRPPSK